MYTKDAEENQQALSAIQSHKTVPEVWRAGLPGALYEVEQMETQQSS